MPSLVFGGVWETVQNKTRAVITNKYVTYIGFQVGMAMYAKYNGIDNAWLFRNENEPIRPPATKEDWHRNKNAALFWMGTAFGCLWTDYAMERISFKKAVGRFFFTSLRADKKWHDYFYYYKWGTSNPEESWKYANRVTIPLKRGDKIFGMTKQENINYGRTENGLWLSWIILFDNPVKTVF